MLQGCGEADLLSGWCGGFLAGGCSWCLQPVTSLADANFPLVLFGAEGDRRASLTSGEGLVLWRGMETIAQGDLEKLTGSTGSPINHVYADRISGAVAVPCWSPAAGRSIRRGKALQQLPSAAKFRCEGGCRQ